MNALVLVMAIVAVVVLVIPVLAAGILAWFWARDRLAAQRSRLRRRRVPPLPRDGRPLTACEQQRLAWIEHGYGDAPKALLRRLR